MRSGEPKVLLRLDGHDPDDLHVGRVRDGVAEERRLPDARLASQNQCTARPGADADQQLSERLLLGATTDQLHAFTVSP